MQGKDITPRNEFWCYYAGELIAIRKGDWKLYFPHTYRSYLDAEPGRDGFPGPYSYKTLEKMELYNLKNDISETTDVSGQHPEIVEKLAKIGKKARYELGDRIQKITGAENREPGKVSE